MKRAKVFVKGVGGLGMASRCGFFAVRQAWVLVQWAEYEE